MHEQAAVSNWAVRMYSLFDPTNFLPFLPNVWNKRALANSRYPDNTKIRDTDVLVGYLVLFWMMLHLLYEKSLNSLFRRMRFPLIRRSRIIKAAWCCGFCFGSVCYLRSSAVQTLSFAAPKQDMTYRELGIALHKSFYFHQAGIDILCHGAWTKGCANLLFASFILNRQNHRWCMIAGNFLVYKAIDVAMVNVCRILLCVLQTVGRSVCKLLFLSHCLIWIYLYLYYVPVLVLWSEEAKYSDTEFRLWLWFAMECLDSILLRLVGRAKATHWLEICLFPPPTQEAIELAGIHKRHKESLRKSNNKTAKRVELWQTLVCVMAIKKKIKRIRQTKNNTDDESASAFDDSEETESLETLRVEDEVAVGQLAEITPDVPNLQE